MMSGHPQRSEGWLMSCNRSAKGGNECSDLWETTFSSLDDFGKIVFISYCMDDYLFCRAYQLPPIPWSSITWTIIGMWKDCYFLIYLFFSNGAWGSAPHWLRSGGCGSSQCHVFDFYWWGYLVSGECLFSFSRNFQGRNLWFLLAFLFSFPHSLCSWSSPTRILLLTSSVFSLISRYAHPHLRFSFLFGFSLYLCRLSFLFFLHWFLWVVALVFLFFLL